MARGLPSGLNSTIPESWNGKGQEPRQECGNGYGYVWVLYCMVMCGCRSVWLCVGVILCGYVWVLFCVVMCGCCSVWLCVGVVLCGYAWVLFCMVMCGCRSVWLRVGVILCGYV